MNVSSDQPALYMAIPAPARFTDLRAHLHKAGIDAAFLHLQLELYLSMTDNLPRQDWASDPHEDHQAWEFRQAIILFQEMIEDKPDQGNGDEEPEESES